MGRDLLLSGDSLALRDGFDLCQLRQVTDVQESLTPILAVDVGLSLLERVGIESDCLCPPLASRLVAPHRYVSYDQSYHENELRKRSPGEG